MIRPRARSLALSLVACALAATAPPAPAAPSDPAPLLLRLPDLGPGYVVDDAGLAGIDTSCLPLRIPERDQPHESSLIGRYRGCVLSFTRAWTASGSSPGPDWVGSVALAFDGPASPQAWLRQPRLLASRLFSRDRRSLRVTEPAPAIGDEAVLLRAEGREPYMHRAFSFAAVVWRTSSVLSIVTSGAGPAGDANAEAAVRLAVVQQTRIVTPTPLPRLVNDDRFVLLDDPTLRAPVLWLGRQLAPHGRFPALRLDATDEDFDPTERPPPLVRLVYGTPHRPDAVKIELWRPRHLRRYLRVPPFAFQCRRRFRVAVPGARAWLRTTYRRERGDCVFDEPFYEAVAFFDGVGVTIDAFGCCQPGADPYDSRAGLRRLLRALRPRQPEAVRTP